MNYITRFIKDIKKYWRYVIYSGKCELKAEVANSYLNWLWWVIEPLCFMGIYTFVFGYLFGSKEPHFTVFVYIGVSLWDFFNHMIMSSVKIVRNNKSVVSKVYIPKYVLILVKLYVNLFKLMICYVLLIILMLLNGITFAPRILWLVPITISLCSFTFGFCCILLHLGVFIDDLGNVVRIGLRMMFYLTGVFYNLHEKLGKKIGPKWAGWLGHINPMSSVMYQARRALIYEKTPNIRFVVAWFCIGLCISIIGIITIYKNENNYVKMI